MHKPRSWGQIYSTRESSKVADNLISHLAVYDPYQHPDEPICETGVSLNEIRGRIKDRLDAVPKHYISERAKSQAIRYLTSYVFNTIGEHDKQVNVFDYIDHFTTKYIKDKTETYWSGKPTRSKIRTTKWMDKYFTPTEGDKEGKGPTASMSGEMFREAIDKGTMVYVGLDGDDMGKMVEEGLLTDDPEIASRISRDIHKAHEEIGKAVKSVKGEVVFDGGDNMLLYVPYDEDFFEICRKAYLDCTTHTVTIGVGERPIQAHFSLVYGKNTGKDKVVVFSPEIESELKEIREKQKGIGDSLQQLKYKANIGWELKSVLKEISMPTDDEVIYATLIQSLIDYDLDDFMKIGLFYTQPSDILFEKICSMSFEDVENQLEKVSTELPLEEHVRTADGGGPFSNEIRHNDTENPISPVKKKVPGRKYNWLNWEDMNPELNKKENSGMAPHMRSQFSDNMPESQFSMGGEPGNAVAPY